MRSHALLSKIKIEDFNPIYAKLNIEDISDKLSDIQILERAIKSRTEVRCTYDDDKHSPYETTIQPLKIANFEGFWYLLAMREGVLKKYYLKNISHTTMLESHFHVDASIDRRLDDALSVWFQEDVEPFDIVLHADKVAAKYFRRRPLPTQRTESMGEDGSMEFSVRITHEMEILPIIKYWIPHLHIMAPDWIQERVEAEISAYQRTLDEWKE